MDEIYDQILGIKYKEENSTISAYILETLERIPEEKESLNDDYLHYVVEKIDEHRIVTVRAYLE
jgi:CBS domain containing-hemolysin-like protein